MMAVCECIWCKNHNTVEIGGGSQQCPCCKHWFYPPRAEQADSLLKCKQCGKRCTGYADVAGERCFFCVNPTI